MGIFEEDRSLKDGKKDWMKLFESRQPDFKLPKEDVVDGEDTIDDIPEDEDMIDEMVASTGVAVVPHRMDLSEEDLNRLDERTKKKIDNLMNRYSKMKEQMSELEEEMNYLKEMGQKQHMLDEMKDQMASVKDEIAQLKEEKEKPSKKKIDPKEKDDIEDDEEKEKPSKKKIDPKEENLKESYNKTMHRYGKVPGDAKFIDPLDRKNKKQKLVENAYQKYLKNRTNAKDSGEEPDKFSIVMG